MYNLYKLIIIFIRYYIKSGNPEHPDDKLYNATFHIMPEKPILGTKLPDTYAKLTDGFYMIDKFSNELGIVSGELDPSLVGKLTKIRIHIPQASETWIIISEIDFAQKPDNTKRLRELIKSTSIYLNFTRPSHN